MDFVFARFFSEHVGVANFFSVLSSTGLDLEGRPIRRRESNRRVAALLDRVGTRLDDDRRAGRFVFEIERAFDVESEAGGRVSGYVDAPRSELLIGRGASRHACQGDAQKYEDVSVPSLYDLLLHLGTKIRRSPRTAIDATPDR